MEGRLNTRANITDESSAVRDIKKSLQKRKQRMANMDLKEQSTPLVMSGSLFWLYGACFSVLSLRFNQVIPALTLNGFLSCSDVKLKVSSYFVIFGIAADMWFICEICIFLIVGNTAASDNPPYSNDCILLNITWTLVWTWLLIL